MRATPASDAATIGRRTTQRTPPLTASFTTRLSTTRPTPRPSAAVRLTFSEAAATYFAATASCVPQGVAPTTSTARSVARGSVVGAPTTPTTHSAGRLVPDVRIGTPSATSAARAMATVVFPCTGPPHRPASGSTPSSRRATTSEGRPNSGSRSPPLRGFRLRWWRATIPGIASSTHRVPTAVTRGGRGPPPLGASNSHPIPSNYGSLCITSADASSTDWLAGGRSRT